MRWRGYGNLPRLRTEEVEEQELQKFPVPALAFVIDGVICMSKIRHRLYEY